MKSRSFCFHAIEFDGARRLRWPCRSRFAPDYKLLGTACADRPSSVGHAASPAAPSKDDHGYQEGPASSRARNGYFFLRTFFIVYDLRVEVRPSGGRTIGGLSF